MNHEQLLELAPLYALGELDTAEQEQFETHLKEGCPKCGAEVEAFRETFSEVAFAAPAVAPPLSLRARALAVAPHDPPPIPSGMIVVRASQGDWRKTEHLGVLMKPLYYDKQRDQLTCLLRVEPGSSIPPHHHNIPEHCLVLEGDIRFGSLVLKAGDYTVAMGDSDHCTVTSDSGCLVLLVSSPHDEPVTRAPAQ